jgi:hypothetical protein
MKRKQKEKLVTILAYIIAIAIVLVAVVGVGWVFSLLWNFVFGSLFNAYINAYQGGAILLMACVIGSYFRREKR